MGLFKIIGSYISSKIEDLYYWIDSLFRKVRRFFRQIRHVFRWFPVIWQDHDWDHGYLFKIMAFKLENMARDHENSPYVGSDKQHKNLLVCAEIMKRLGEDEFYCTNLWDQKDDRCKCADSLWTEIPITDNLLETKLNICKYCRILFLQGNKKKQADLDYFCYLFRKNAFYWWT